MQIPFQIILDKLEINLVNICKLLNDDDWDQLINNLSAFNKSLQKEEFNNNLDVISKQMTELINKQDPVKNVLFNNEFHPRVRGAISPLNQQPEKISEKLLCQRLDALISHAKKLKETKSQKKDVKYSK